jgi:tetratricopeptide (TPR) repeat protein
VRGAVLIALALAAGCSTVTPRHRDSLAEARSLAARGQAHYDLGEYGLAIAAYSEAYRIHPSPGLLFNAAQAYRRSGDCVTATLLYENYLRLARRSPYRRLVRQHLASIAECHRRYTVSWER